MLDVKQLKTALEMLELEKKIPKEKIIDAIEQSIAAAYKKEYGKRGQIIRAKLDMDTGIATFEQVKVIVDETLVRMPDAEEEEEVSTFKGAVEDSRTTRHEQIDTSKVTGRASSGEEDDEDTRPKFNEEHHIFLSDAKLMKRGAELNDEIIFPLDMQNDFGRIAAQTAKQVIMQKLREAEKESVAAEFGGKENSIITGVVQRSDRGTLFVDLGRTTAIMPFEEQLPNETFRPGERIRAFLFGFEDTGRGLSVRLSRSHPKFLIELFKVEAPEIASGVVEIKGVAREPGSRSKIAVYTADNTIDPIGTCVGQRGARVTAVTSELSGEKIDIIEWSEDPATFIAGALSPASPLYIEILEDERKAIVTVAREEQSLAIGKGGQNVRLAARLTGFKIDIKVDEEDFVAEEKVSSSDSDHDLKNETVENSEAEAVTQSETLSEESTDKVVENLEN
jgi:N utilization substance protein A